MATWYLMNNVWVGTVRKFAGSYIDDTVTDTTSITNAGGKLAASSITGLAAASARAIQVRLSGGDEEEMESIMNAALDAAQSASETSNAGDIATNAADVATNAADIATNAADIITAQAAADAAQADVNTVSPGIPMQNILRALGAPGALQAGDTVTIGADVYEFNAATPPAAGTAGYIWVYQGADSATSRANLINAINNVTDAANITYDGAVTENFVASAGITTGDILIQSADAPGGTPTPSATATACSEGLTTVTDIWDNATCQYGKVQAASGCAAITATVGAEELARGTLDVTFPFAPSSAVAIDRSRPHDEVLTISTNTVSVTLTGGGSPNIQSGDVVDIIAFE